MTGASANQRHAGLGVVILAAGASSRMGRPKLLLPWGGTTVLGHQAGLWSGLGACQIGVVCAVGDEALSKEVARLIAGCPSLVRIPNPDPAAGMMGSVRCAARWDGWQPGLERWAISLGDQPLVLPATLGRLIEFGTARPGSICQPARGGRGRHPVLVPARIFAALAGTVEPTLKRFIESHANLRALMESNDPGLDLDLDEPADYERALALAFRAGSPTREGGS